MGGIVVTVVALVAFGVFVVFEADVCFKGGGGRGAQPSVYATPSPSIVCVPIKPVGPPRYWLISSCIQTCR